MKNLVFILIIMCLPLKVAGQKTENKPKMSVEIGLIKIVPEKNIDNETFSTMHGYTTFIETNAELGANLKFTLPTKIEYLDIIFGAMYFGGTEMGYSDSHELNDGQPINGHDWNTSSYKYLFNGGGVYVGVSPKIKGKHFGLTSDIALGIFPFKEYHSAAFGYDNPERNYSIERFRASTFGGMASVGFYLKYGAISINPSLNMIVAGGANASFLFYGFVLPLTIHF